MNNLNAQIRSQKILDLDDKRGKATSETTLGEAFKKNLKAMLVGEGGLLDPNNKENITDQPKTKNFLDIQKNNRRESGVT